MVSPGFSMVNFEDLRDLAVRPLNVEKGFHRGGPSLSVAGNTSALWRVRATAPAKRRSLFTNAERGYWTLGCSRADRRLRPEED
jgi:hypothetical protein